MITVTISKNAKKEYRAVSSIGHAGYAKRGQDIVCAAVSVLLINTLNAIEAFTDDKELMNIVENEEEGVLHCRFHSALSERSILLLDTMVLGLEEIHKEYSSKYLRLIYEEV